MHRYAVLTAIATFLLLLAGSLVTSTDSGLAVPDWPLSYGLWFPPMVGGILFEHGHRMIAGLVGLMILGLAAWLWGAEPRAWVRRLGYAAACAVLLQALLGGLTVLLLLPAAVSIAHACVAQLVFGLMVSLAGVTAPGWGRGLPPSAGAEATSMLQRLGTILVVAVFLQILLGAVIRHTGLGVWGHVAGAVVVVGLGHALSARVKRTLPMTHPARAHAARLLWLLTAQVVAGVVVWRHRDWLGWRTLHVATGALILAQAVVLMWMARSHARPVSGTLGGVRHL